MEIQLEKQPKKFLDKADDDLFDRLSVGMQGLKELTGDIKKMIGGKNEYRLRIGDYRIIFEIRETIVITKIGPRGAVYKK